MTEEITLRTSLLALSIYCFIGLGCHAAPPPSPPPGPAPAQGSATPAPEVRRSSKFGYSWTLPRGWRFTPPGALYPAPTVPSIDVIAAKTDKGPIVLVFVTDCLTTVPGLHTADHPRAYEELVERGERYLRNAGLEPSATRPISMLGLNGAEVSADPITGGISVRSFYRENRSFQFVCFDHGNGSEWGCSSAFSSFQITDMPEGPAENDVPRVRHLRDARLGFAFDAPDDSWLSIGPRTGAGGAEVVYVWKNAERQIDVGTIDLTLAPHSPTATEMARELASAARRSGAVVVEKDDTLAGLPCHRLEIAKPSGDKQDVLVLLRNHVFYLVLVTQPVRDPRLLAAVKKGFRLTPKSQMDPQ